MISNEVACVTVCCNVHYNVHNDLIAILLASQCLHACNSVADKGSVLV